jgi:hypothetical protein
MNRMKDLIDKSPINRQIGKQTSNGAFTREILQSIFSVRFHCAFRSAFLQCVFVGCETSHRRAVSANDLKEDLIDWA